MKDKVFAVCNELTAQGVKVTQANVREALGGGSYSTIVPIIKAWKDGSGVIGTSEENAPKTPVEIAAEVAKFSNAIWNKCASYFETAMEALRREYTAKIEEVNNELKDALSEIRELEKINTQLVIENTEAKGKDSVIQELAHTNAECNREIINFFNEKQALQRKNLELELNYEKQAEEIARLLKIVESMQNSELETPDPTENAIEIITETKPKKRSTKKTTPALPTEQQAAPLFYYVLNEDDIIKLICPSEQNATLEAESMSQFLGKKHRARLSANVYDTEQQFKG